MSKIYLIKVDKVLMSYHDKIFKKDVACVKHMLHTHTFTIRSFMMRPHFCPHRDLQERNVAWIDQTPSDQLPFLKLPEGYAKRKFFP